MRSISLPLSSYFFSSLFMQWWLLSQSTPVVIFKKFEGGSLLMPSVTFLCHIQEILSAIYFFSEKLQKIWKASASFYSPYHCFSASNSYLAIRLDHKNLTKILIYSQFVYFNLNIFSFLSNSFVLHCNKREKCQKHKPDHILPLLIPFNDFPLSPW